MYAIRKELVHAVIDRSFNLIDTNIHNDIHKQQEFQIQTVLADESLTKEEKTEATKILSRDYDRDKLIYNVGTKRICENCNRKCLATTYCEFCIRNHLKMKFSSWTSGNDDIDSLIQTCQMETIEPGRVAEWIPYDNLQNIKYLTEGGCSKIYTADWIDGCFWEWNSEKQQFTRKFESSSQSVILKRLENVENASQSWLDEVCDLKI